MYEYIPDRFHISLTQIFWEMIFEWPLQSRNTIGTLQFVVDALNFKRKFEQGIEDQCFFSLGEIFTFYGRLNTRDHFSFNMALLKQVRLKDRYLN